MTKPIIIELRHVTQGGPGVLVLFKCTSGEVKSSAVERDFKTQEEAARFIEGMRATLAWQKAGFEFKENP